MQINNLLKWQWCGCSHTTADKMQAGNVRAPRVPAQCLPGWAEQARLQEILWSGKSLGIQHQVSSVSSLVDKQCALILSQSFCNWNLCNTWHFYSPRLTKKQSLTDLFHFTFNLHSKNCITDSCYLSLHQCRDQKKQNFIHNLLLFKLSWEQKKLYVNNLSSERFLLRIINISEKGTWSSLWSIEYL